jgi:tetratricopeptide (TPR) repeat protein
VGRAVQQEVSGPSPDSLADARAALGYAKFAYKMDWAGAKTELKRTIELNPGSVNAHYDYAQYLRTRGRFAESISEGRRAEELDPVSPRIIRIIGYYYLAAGRYGDSISQFKRALSGCMGSVLAIQILLLTSSISSANLNANSYLLSSNN